MPNAIKNSGLLFGSVMTIIVGILCTHCVWILVSIVNRDIITSFFRDRLHTALPLIVISIGHRILFLFLSVSPVTALAIDSHVSAFHTNISIQATFCMKTREKEQLVQKTKIMFNVDFLHLGQSFSLKIRNTVQEETNNRERNATCWLNVMGQRRRSDSIAESLCSIVQFIIIWQKEIEKKRNFSFSFTGFSLLLLLSAWCRYHKTYKVLL